ncbi:ATPase domain-containing protein [Archangium primigenium]|uniref:ATPase domain-containing protein n=1 Tax=[Archangium] primigenium TaxID=2792470 RepID=UPI00195D6365|nr:ATPase domain-containing protein [Archangium primigenium]MBM7113646.1 circadian clock protein KaiC [Archangium primigenium]
MSNAETRGAGDTEAHEGRVTSGIPRLDFILQGGLKQGGTYALMGPPGSGKTILANQFCFNHIARDDGRCVYMTLLIESHGKMLRHLEQLSFFRMESVPEKVYYISGYQKVRDEGFAGLLELIRATLRERRATIFVIDGMESAEQFASSRQAYGEFIHSLQALMSLLGCTTLLLSNVRERTHVEHTLVDGVLELSDQLIGPRAVRELTVHKFRGSNYLRGRHEVEISSAGIVVHPRTEVQFAHPVSSGQEMRHRMAFGLPRLDEMLGGGLPSGSTTALLGAPGTGKTLLGLSFLVEGARRGEKGMYFGFYEPPPRLIEKAEAVGLPLGRYVREGGITLVWQPPLEHFMDALAEQLLEPLRLEGSKGLRRLFVDGAEGFRAAAVYQERMPRFLSALTNQLRSLDVTTVMTDELELFQPQLNLPTAELANVVESVVLLRYVEMRSQIRRLLSIMKMRESRYDTSLREFRISQDGIDVADSFRSAESILSGMSRMRDDARDPDDTERGGASAARSKKARAAKKTTKKKDARPKPTRGSGGSRRGPRGSRGDGGGP